ncbi:MAG: MBL fold metallo-hydrolase [Pseudomonadota bacterium]
MRSVEVLAGLAMVFSLAQAQAAPAREVVTVTPLGSHQGEFCPLDRALVFEDPDGTRLLYDAGRTVAGGDDPRLGNIDAILISHLHGDHLGDRRIESVAEGPCEPLDFPVDTTPNGNSVEIAVAKEAQVISGSEMASFLGNKLRAAGGRAEQSRLVRFGASVAVGGVEITTVPAAHSNGVSPAFIGGALGEQMADAGLTAYAGPPTGFVLTFSNDLVVYLSGDTGITAEQESVVNDYYGAELVVINIGDTYTTGPREAAHVINDMIRPRSVIASHANEVATRRGRLVDGTRTAAFVEASRTPVYIPRSGQRMRFFGNGQRAD